MEFYSPSNLLLSTDARVKLILTLASLLTISLLPFKAWGAYILLYALLLSFELLSGKGLDYYLRHSLIAFPFVLSALPLIFTVPSPEWYTLPWLNLSISPLGLERLIGILIKIWLSVQAALLFTSTTSPQQILLALSGIGVPPILIEILSLMLRYLSIFRSEAERMLRARACRSVTLPEGGLKSGGSVLWRAEVSGQMVGSLMLRSFERGERVYQAMLSRGYNGNPIDREAGHFNRKEKGMLMAGLLSLFFLMIFGMIVY